ncbi:MAG: aspartyl/asparaginyl beta-hydroxylase domain-containing protein [Planctomycetaceae bacterium]|nr:aspartyl/asparaginyl beta-hydroxylase domain-containing protein [Planctomycetaceae bacterium]
MDLLSFLTACLERHRRPLDPRGHRQRRGAGAGPGRGTLEGAPQGGGSSRRWSKRSSRFTAYPRAGPALDRIKDQHDDGREGESILFDDSWDHEVYNKGGSEWVDLIVDVRRPMPFFSTPSTGSSSPS